VNIELHIDTLVLQGLGAHHQDEIRAVVERELGALLSREGLATSFESTTTLHQIDAEHLHLRADSSAETIGIQLARSIHRGLRG